MIVFDLDEVKSDRISEIKSEAGSLIVTRFPLWKQNNMQARVAELLDKKFDGSITKEQQVELDYYKEVWGWVNAVRAASNSAEDLVRSASTLEEIESVIPMWPD